MENLGEQELPHRMRAHTEQHTQGTESKKANMKESKSNFWGGYGLVRIGEGIDKLRSSVFERVKL